VLQLENIPWWGKNILRGSKRAFEGAKHTKYNKINNNLHEFRNFQEEGGKIAVRELSPPGPP